MILNATFEEQAETLNADFGKMVSVPTAEKAVLYIPQTLSEAQKTQVKENIGVTDEYINGLINTALGVIENGTY